MPPPLVLRPLAIFKLEIVNKTLLLTLIRRAGLLFVSPLIVTLWPLASKKVLFVITMVLVSVMTPSAAKKLTPSRRHRQRVATKNQQSGTALLADWRLINKFISISRARIRPWQCNWLAGRNGLAFH